MHEGSKVSTTPAIPAPRAPEPDPAVPPHSTAQPAPSDPPVRDDPAGMPDPADPADQPDQVDAADQPDQADPADQPDQADPADQPDPDQPGQADPADQPDPDQPGQADAADLAEPVVPDEPVDAAEPVVPVEPADAAPATGASVTMPGRRRTRMAWVVAPGVLLLVLIVGLAVLRASPKREAAAAGPTASAAPSASAATPYDKAVAALGEQSAALLRGDEAGFLATVDGGLRTRYRDLFRSLRGLGVSRFEYRPDIGQAVKNDPAAISVRVDLVYCLGAAMCPDGGVGRGLPPHIEQVLTLRPAGDRYVISRSGAAPDPAYPQPLPWENDRLVLAQGSRVTLAASPDQAGRLAAILPVADAAARVDDKFAALNGTPQPRYRVYLAGEKQWKTWFKGESSQWAIGLAVPLNKYGTDVMLRLKYMTDPVVLRVTLQHELGHVVTLTGAFRADAAEDTWLSEGIAEYIGWWPRPATGSLRLASVRWALNGGHRPTSMIPAQPGAKASLRAGDAFYGLSHFAVDCMAHKYGQRKLFDFVRLVLTEDNSYDQAARDAYGVGFTTVDKACVTWIRQQA